MSKKLPKTKIYGLILLVAALLLWAPLPIPFKSTIAAVAVAVIGILLLLR